MANKIDSLLRENYRSTIIGGVLILALVISVGLMVYRVNVARNPPEYEGTIVEKWAGYSHTEEGSFPYFRLRVKSSRGEQIDVNIDEDTYHRATIGAWIRKTRSGIQLEPGAAPLSFGRSDASRNFDFSFGRG